LPVVDDLDEHVSFSPLLDRRQRHRRRDDHLLELSEDWMRDLDRTMREIRDEQQRLRLEQRERIQALEAQLKTLYRTLGLDSEGVPVKGGLADTFALTRSGKRLIVILASFVLGLYWIAGTGTEWLKHLLKVSP
jgi:hypothetical protein